MGPYGFAPGLPRGLCCGPSRELLRPFRCEVFFTHAQGTTDYNGVYVMPSSRGLPSAWLLRSDRDLTGRDAHRAPRSDERGASSASGAHV